MKILLVEDDEATVKLLQLALTQQQYTIDVAFDGKAGWQLAESIDYDLILLDVMLPKLDGISFCRRLRAQQKNVAVLMMTARDTVSDRVLGLDAGADDYLVKPFKLEELAARVRSLLRRGKDTVVSQLEWGDIRIDAIGGEAYHRDRPLQLSRREHDILELFIRHPKQVFSRAKILDLLWPLDSAPAEDTVKAHIKGLRNKLKAVDASPDLIEAVYGQGYRLNPTMLKESAKASLSPRANGTEQRREPAEQRVLAKVAQIWQSTKFHSIGHVTMLEHTTSLLSAGNLSDELARMAAQAAHKLVGSLGMFGFQDGSILARRVEELFQTPQALEQEQISQLNALILELRQVVETATVPSSPSTLPSSTQLPKDEQLPLLLIVDADRKFADRLALEAIARGYRCEIAPTPVAAMELIAREYPACAIAELNFPDTDENSWQLLSDLASAPSPIPTLVLTASDSFSNRLQVIRCSGGIFLQKPSHPSVVMDSVTQLLQSDRRKVVKILAVDDDPQVLKLLHTQLEPHGIELISLDDPSQFWSVLEETMPDMTILDVTMPDISGIELCQIIRSDPSWNLMPVIFLTAHSDDATLQTLFAVGADDWISKPPTESMLVTRIFKRLERTNRLRLQAEIDPLTGVANRRKSSDEIKRLIGLAKRYDQQLCLSILDLDKLKQINGLYGKDCGDKVLHQIGTLFYQQFRSEDVVACWGGGEFVVGMYGINKVDCVERLAEILENIRQVEFSDEKGCSFHVSFSGGVAQYPIDGGDLDSLYKVANAVLQQAKSTGRDRILPVGWQPPNSELQFNADVVLVSDEAIVPYQILRDLGTRGYHTVWLSDYHAAVEKLCESSLRPKAIILGEAPSELNHLELLKRLKRKKVLQHIRVILLTNNSREAEQALELGAFDYVVQPWTVSVLLQRLRRALKT
jgi:diguanylate cyclase (GGDEF)-like protein